MGQSIPSPLKYNILDKDQNDIVVNDLLTFETQVDEDFRKEIEEEIDETTSIILKNFIYSKDPDTVIENTFSWQCTLKNLVNNRYFLKYPYILTTSSEKDSVDHLEIQTPEDFLDLYIEYFTFEGREVARGKFVKEQLFACEDEELDEFLDERVDYSDEELNELPDY